jgi:hypothetical protein
VDVNVEGNEFLCVDVIGHLENGAALSTRADGVDAYSSSTSAARC